MHGELGCGSQIALPVIVRCNAHSHWCHAAPRRDREGHRARQQCTVRCHQRISDAISADSGRYKLPLFQGVNFDQADADAAILAGEDDCELTGRQQGKDAGFFRVLKGQAVRGQQARRDRIIGPLSLAMRVAPFASCNSRVGSSSTGLGPNWASDGPLPRGARRDRILSIRSFARLL